MARGRPRKDGSKPGQKKVEPEPEMMLEGARTKRKAASACIKTVMHRYNITPTATAKEEMNGRENDNDISSGLEVSAKDLNPEENWIRVEAVPPDDQGYFKIMNPETRLFLTGNEQLEIQKEINSKLWLIL